MKSSIPEISSKWYTPAGILVEVIDIVQIARCSVFIKCSVVASGRIIVRDLEQFSQFTPKD
jgi:hypothetical protein